MQEYVHNDYVTPQLITHIVIVTTITVSATVTITVATIIVTVSWLKMIDPTALAAVSFRCIRTSSHQLNTLEACRWLFFVVFAGTEVPFVDTEGVHALNSVRQQ